MLLELLRCTNLTDQEANGCDNNDHFQLALCLKIELLKTNLSSVESGIGNLPGKERFAPNYFHVEIQKSLTGIFAQEANIQ